MFKNIAVLSKAEIQDIIRSGNLSEKVLNTEGNIFVISINDSLTPPTIPFEHKNVLTLFFDDVSCDTERAKMLGLTPFSISIASKIVDFISSINENNRTDNTLIVHCGAGVSRSGAVASFIADMYGYTREKLLLENPMIKPNTDVLVTLKREFYKRSGMFS